MSPLTLYLGKFFGLSCLLVFAVLAIRPRSSQAAITALVGDPALMLITGIVTTAAGVATVIAHNIWSGGALPVVVTLFGWITLLKGLALMAAPPSWLRGLYRSVYGARRFHLVMAAGTAFSAWLTVIAFRA
jgi:hypothetical protein